ncbi:MAG: S-layer homology domain-containing protein [Oscillospiraceae bacterium]|nr:S-layer homology domain-containing protein [Oscillospiraceae bacterium]
MFNSPVDIEAFNSDGELVARIANNTVDTSIIGEVFAWVNEGEKQFHLPPEGEFTFRLTATGSGTMTYNIEDIALSTGETVEQKLFENVSLYNGRELLSIVGDTTATPDVRLLVVENGQPVAEVLEDGSEIPILPFADISPTYWFYPYVRNVFQRNIMQGASPTEFHPTGDFTRSMVVATLYRMVYGGPAREIPYANNRTVFSDVYAGAWYSHYVIWAYDYGIVSGVGENLFAPGQPVTRQEFAVMMHRFAGAMGHDTAVRQGPQWNSFTDLNQIATWPGAREALTWANYHGLIGGRPGPIIVPGGTAIRAEAAAILMRYVEAFGTGGTPQRPPQQPTPTALDVRALLGQNLGDVRHLLGEQLDAWEWLFFTDVSVLLLHYPEIIINVFVYYPALDVNPESRGRANVTFGSINGYSTRADVRSAFGVPYETGETENNLFYYFYFLDDIFVFFDFDRNGQLQAIHAGLFDWAA